MISSADTYNFKVPPLSKSQQAPAKEGGGAQKGVHQQQHLRGIPQSQSSQQQSQQYQLQVMRNTAQITSSGIHQQSTTAAATSMYSNFTSTNYGVGSGFGVNGKTNQHLLEGSLGGTEQSKRASTSLQRKNPRQRAISSGKMHSESDERVPSAGQIGAASQQHDYTRYYDMSRKAMATEEGLESFQSTQQGQQFDPQGEHSLSQQQQQQQKQRNSQIAEITLTPTNINYNKNVSFLAAELYESSHSPNANTVGTTYLNSSAISNHINSSSNPSRVGVSSKLGTRELSPNHRDNSATGTKNVFRILPKNSALMQPNSILPKIQQTFCEAPIQNNNFNSISNCSNDEENKYSGIHNTSTGCGATNSIQLTQISSNNNNNNNLKSLSLYLTNKSRDDDTRLLLDSQVFAKMDREALVIRLSILEIENKETKIHNLHLSEKFKELLDEYRRYKEFMDNVDRKSLYQKHVQRLANLSKQLYDSKTTIVERDQCIRELQEELRVQLIELNRISSIMGDYDAIKQAEIDAIEEAHKALLSEQAARVDELLKLNRKMANFEFMYNDLQEKLKEETRRLNSIIDKQEDRYRLLMQRWQETDKEIQLVKDKARIHDLELKKLIEKHNLTLQVKTEEFDERYRKSEIESFQQLLEKSEEIKKLSEKVAELTKKNLELELDLKEARDNLLQFQEETKHTQEEQGGVTITIQQLNEQKTQEIENLTFQVDTMEKSIYESNLLLQERKEEVESLQSQLNGVQQRNEELERLRQEMEEAHLEELSKVFAQQNELTHSLNLKIQELKAHYEVEIERMSNECAEKVRLCSQTANDAQRQCQILKVTYNQEIERKDNEIDFLKNKIYQEKQRLKDQVESQYRDVVRDLERRAEYLSNELDTQKWDIENGICEDLAVYNRNSRFWKRSREIRAQKFLTRHDDTDEEDEAAGVSSKSNQQSPRKSNRKYQITPQDRLRLRLQVIASCAKAFADQQNIIDRLRDQFESLTGRRPTGLPARRESLNPMMTKSQIRALTRTPKNSSDRNQTPDGQQQRYDYFDQEMEEMQQLMNERLSAKVGELEEELMNERTAMIEMQAKFVKSEIEMQENFKIKQKQIQAQLDFASQNKTQAVFQKDIIIEKQNNKIEDLKRTNADLAASNQMNVAQLSKMRKEVTEAEAKQATQIETLKIQIENLQFDVNNKEARPQDKKEITRLLELVNEKNEDIKMLKYQVNQIIKPEKIVGNADRASSKAKS